MNIVTIWGSLKEWLPLLCLWWVDEEKLPVTLRALDMLLLWSEWLLSLPDSALLWLPLLLWCTWRLVWFPTTASWWLLLSDEPSLWEWVWEAFTSPASTWWPHMLKASGFSIGSFGFIMIPPLSLRALSKYAVYGTLSLSQFPNFGTWEFWFGQAIGKRFVREWIWVHKNWSGLGSEIRVMLFSHVTT